MELLDVYDNNGVVTGRTVVRGDKSAVLSDNEHIAVAVIFIENSNGEFLMQKTSFEKGGEFSSTGGHVVSGQTPYESILREVEEELGIDVTNDDIKDLGYIIYDRPIRYMFYLKKDIDLSLIIVQEEEVEYVKYMSVDEIEGKLKEKLENEQEIKTEGGIE